LQEIRPGLVEELAPDGETLGSVTVTHLEPRASKHEIQCARVRLSSTLLWRSPDEVPGSRE